MRIWRWCLFAALILTLVLAGSPHGASRAAYSVKTVLQDGMVPGVDYLPGQVLVRFRAGAVLPEASALPSGVRRLESLPGPGLEVWSAPVGGELELVSRLKTLPGVELAGLNYLYHLTAVPDDPEFPKQWAHAQANAPEGWQITTGSQEVIIAVIDSGVDLNHPDLKSKLVAGKNLYNSEPTAGDKHGHGTHVAGIAAALSDNGEGIAGVSWGARIMPIRVTDSKGSGPTSVVASGISWAVANGARVINLSLGSNRVDNVLADAIAKARASGALVVASAGNDHVSTPFYPAALEGVLAVGATGPSGEQASYSNFGSYLDVMAPGGERSLDATGILSTVPTYDVYLNTHVNGFRRGYEYLSGTSMAAPYVSGLAALVWSLNPDLSPTEVSQIITSTVRDLSVPGWDPVYGYGLVDVGSAAAAAQASRNVVAELTLEEDTEEDGYTLSWSAVTGAQAYTLEQAGTADFESAIVRYRGSELEYRVTGQAEGTWYYRVRAEGLGTSVPWSEIKSIAVGPSALPAPLSFTAAPGNEEGELALSWEPVSGASGYILEESRDPYFSHPEVIYSGSEARKRLSGRDFGTWHYRVRATSAEGNGPWSQTQVRLAFSLFLPLTRR